VHQDEATSTCMPPPPCWPYKRHSRASHPRIHRFKSNILGDAAETARRLRRPNRCQNRPTLEAKEPTICGLSRACQRARAGGCSRSRAAKASYSELSRTTMYASPAAMRMEEATRAAIFSTGSEIAGSPACSASARVMCRGEDRDKGGVRV